MFCPRCKTDIRDDMAYCPECGMKLERCPVCQQPVMTNAKFCSSCGYELSTYQKSHLDGYYEPIHDIHQQPIDESFEDIPVNKKVNKKKVISITLIVVLLMGISYMYLYHGPQANLIQNEPQPEFKVEAMEIGSMTSNPSKVGNVNQSGQVYQDNDMIYICDDNGYLVSMNRKLQDKKTLVNKKCEYIQVVGDVIYYADENNYICKMPKDGKNSQILLNQAVYYMVYKDNKLYYQLDDNGKENIYVYDLKTNQQTKLNDRKSYNLNVLDDCIYFTSDDGIYRINLDGKGEEKLIGGTVYNLIYQDGVLYYTIQNQLMSYDIENKKTELIINEPCQLLNMNDTDIFYFTSSAEVNRYNLKTKETVRLYSGNIEATYIVGDKVVITTSATYKNKGYKLITDMNGENQQRLFVSQEGDFI